jgi:hypothetical protein
LAVTAAGIAAGIVIATVAGSQDELPPGDDGRVHSQPGPQTPIPPGPSLAADLAKPAVSRSPGRLHGEPDAAVASPSCGATTTAVNPEASELYVPGFTVAEAGQCADGTTIANRFNSSGPETVGRRLFVGPAQVPFDAPIDRLITLTVGGRPAIAQLPMPEYTHTLRLAVVERFPKPKQPGILVFVEDSFRSLEEAAELAEQLLRAP